MITRVRISTTVGSDGSIHVVKDDVTAAGFQAGDRVELQVVRALVTGDDKVLADSTEEQEQLDRDIAALQALPYEEFMARFRSTFPIPNDVDIDELIRQGQELAADEFWEKFHRGNA